MVGMPLKHTHKQNIHTLTHSRLIVVEWACHRINRSSLNTMHTHTQFNPLSGRSSHRERETDRRTFPPQCCTLQTAAARLTCGGDTSVSVILTICQTLAQGEEHARAPARV